jgi:predicted nuclease of predicted toxin-antitoxin system
LRLICDANIGTRLVDAFAAARHDVVRSIRALTPTASDEAILAYAVAEQRVLITCDSDFGEQIFLKGQLPPPAVVYVQFEPENVSDIIPRILPILDSEEIWGRMIVIGDSANRMTLFPKRELK